MAKDTGPLMSLDARGTIAKTLVYSSWRGRAYVRRWVSPAQPRTMAQIETRHTFSWLQQVWKRAPTLLTQTWFAGAAGRPLTDRNLFTKDNLGQLISESDLTNFTFVGGARGGLPPTAMVITPGANQLSVAITAPAAPPGWTIAAAVAAAIPDQDPQTGTLYTISAVSDASSPYVCVITGLVSAQLYQVAAWLLWTKPDGSTAYSINIRDMDTPT